MGVGARRGQIHTLVDRTLRLWKMQACEGWAWYERSPDGPALSRSLAIAGEACNSAAHSRDQDDCLLARSIRRNSDGVQHLRSRFRGKCWSQGLAGLCGKCMRKRCFEIWIMRRLRNMKWRSFTCAPKNLVDYLPWTLAFGAWAEAQVWLI